MIDLLIIADVRGWAFERRARALQRYAPADFNVDIDYMGDAGALSGISEYDIIFNIEYGMTRRVRQALRSCQSKAPLVNSHNADHRRAKDQFDDSREMADYIIFNNRQTYEYYGSLPGTCNISNGVELHDWGADASPGEREDKALWTGGDKPGKGCSDFMVPLSKIMGDCEFDLRPIGRDGWTGPERAVNTEVIWPTDRMRDWYNTGKIILCCSDSDATPNYVLEGMACGLVPVTTRVGNAMEFGEGGKNCCFFEKNFSDAQKAIRHAIENYEEMSKAALEAISSWGWETRSQLFYEVFRSVLNGNPPAPFSYKDAERHVE